MTTQPLSTVTTTWHQQPRGILSSYQPSSFQPPVMRVTCQGQITLPPRTSQEVKPKLTSSRRGRRSIVLPEQREQTRRIKKQNMERRRRACISGKMDALHSLALQIIGFNPEEQQLFKVEKADILNTCHRVLESVSTIAKNDPDLRNCLKQLRSNVSTTIRASDLDRASRPILSSYSNSNYSHHFCSDNKENLPRPILPRSHMSTPKLQRIPIPKWPLTQSCHNNNDQLTKPFSLTSPSFQDSGISCDSINRQCHPRGDTISQCQSSPSIECSIYTSVIDHQLSGIPRLHITTNQEPSCQQVSSQCPTLSIAPSSMIQCSKPHLSSSAFRRVLPRSAEQPPSECPRPVSQKPLQLTNSCASQSSPVQNVWRPYI